MDREGLYSLIGWRNRYRRGDDALMFVLNFIRDNQTVFHLGITFITVVFTAFWTYKLFVKRRQKYPHANITHRAEHWSISSDKTLLRVVVKISNEGEVLLRLVSGFTSVQKMMPWPPELLESIGQDKEFVKKGQTEGEWPPLCERKLPFKEREQEIEPGEMDELHLDFIIDSKVQIVVLYTYLRNERKRICKRKRLEWGWTTKSIHDLRSLCMSKRESAIEDSDG